MSYIVQKNIKLIYLCQIVFVTIFYDYGNVTKFIWDIVIQKRCD